MTRKRQSPRKRPPRVDPGPPATNPELGRVLLEVVDKQLRDGDPPETRATLDRLVAAGYTPEGARQLIACVVTNEIFEVMKHGQPYDEARYIAALHRLPRLPWE